MHDQVTELYRRYTNMDELNILKLNGDKTEYIMFGTRHQLAKIEPLDIKVGPAFYIPSGRS